MKKFKNEVQNGKNEREKRSSMEKISTNFKSEKVAFSKNIKHTYMAELFTMLI